MNSTAKNEQIHVARQSPSYWRVIFDNPPLNLMGPEFVLRFKEIVTEIENDEKVRVVVQARRSELDRQADRRGTFGPSAPTSS